MGNIRNFKGYFRDNVSDDILADIVSTVILGTRDAARRIVDDVKEGVYTKHVARDLFPYARRASIESRLFDLIAEFPGVTVSSQLNRSHSHYHTRIGVGNVIMTASAVDTPYGLARDAEFRNSYAGAQTRFDIVQDRTLSQVHFVEDPDLQDVLYGIILYCPAENNRFDIGSVRVGFPNFDCTKYIDRIDLLRLFPEATVRTEIEQIQDQAIVSLLLDEQERLPLLHTQVTVDKV